MMGVPYTNWSCHLALSSSGHDCIEYSKMIVQLEHQWKKKIQEALDIDFKPNNLNSDDGLKINEAWKHVLRNIS